MPITLITKRISGRKFIAIFIAVFIAIQAKSRYIGVNIGVYLGILSRLYPIFDDEYRKNHEYFRRYPHILEHTRRKSKAVSPLCKRV